jgi:hypothetical protein
LTLKFGARLRFVPGQFLSPGTPAAAPRRQHQPRRQRKNRECPEAPRQSRPERLDPPAERCAVSRSLSEPPRCFTLQHPAGRGMHFEPSFTLLEAAFRRLAQQFFNWPFRFH